MYSSRPTVYNIFKAMFSTGVEILQDGVTDRFRAAIVELKQKAMISKGYLNQPKGKSLITQKEYDLAKLKQIEKEKKTVKPLGKPEVKVVPKSVVKPDSKVVKPVTPTKPVTKPSKTITSKTTVKPTPTKANGKSKTTPKVTTSKKK